jgi:hypothetical protein
MTAADSGLMKLMAWAVGIFLLGQCVAGGFGFISSMRAVRQSGAVLDQSVQLLQRNRQVAESLDRLLRDLSERAKAGDSAAKRVLEASGFRLEGGAKAGMTPVPQK